MIRLVTVQRTAALVGIVVALISAGPFDTPAKAGTLACSNPSLSPDVTFKITGPSGIGFCEVAVPSWNDSEAHLNSDQLFGLTNDQPNLGDPGWVQIEKNDSDTNGVIDGTGLLQTTGDLRSGTWSIADSVWDMYGTIALALIDGAKALPGNYIAYMILEDTTNADGIPGRTEGTFDSPFFNSDGGGKDISHFSLYGHAIALNPPPMFPPNPVPLPAALPLFAGGLGLLGFLGWRRKRMAAA